MSAELIVYERLKNHSPLLTLVPVANMHAQVVPQSQSRNQPYIRFDLYTTTTDYHLRGRTKVINAYMQVDCSANSLEALNAISLQVREALDGFRGDVLGHRVQGIFWEDELTRDEQQQAASDERRYFRRIDFQVVYEG